MCRLSLIQLKPFFSPLEIPNAEPLAEVAAITKPIVEESPWPVVYNCKPLSLSVIFVHAFKHTSSVYGLAFSPDENFLAVEVEIGGRTHLYDVMSMSMKGLVFTFICLAECPNTLNTLHSVSWLNIPVTTKKNLVHTSYDA